MHLRALLVVPIFACASTQPKHPVKSVKVEGNRAFSDKTLVDRLAMRPPQGFIVKKATEFDPIALDIDRKRVESFYHERGFFDASVEDVDVKPNGKGVSVEIHLVEGEPTQIASVEVNGVKTDFARPVIKREAPEVKAGKRLDHPKYLIAKAALEQALVKAGYAHAQVTGVVEVDRVARRAVIRLDADPGPLVHFGDVRVQGLNKVPLDTVLARVAFDTGDVFDPEALSATEGKLYQLGLFSSVRADWDREGRPPVSDITIKVTEGMRHEVRFGVGAGADRTRWEVRTRGGYTVHGILGSALNTLRLEARPGYSWLRGNESKNGPSIEASAALSRDDWIVPRLQGTTLVAYEREPRQGYTIQGPRVNLGVSRPFLNDDMLNLHFAWEMRYVDYIDADPMIFGDDARAARLAYFQQRAVLDRRDMPLDARRGFYADAHLEEGGAFSGSEATFIKTELDGRGYIPILERLTLAGRIAGGKLVPYNTDDSPLPLRFYGGGGVAHRGFGFQRLSPQVNGLPIGGDESLLMTAEARLDVFKFKKQWFSVVPFVDAGDVTGPPSHIDVGNLHYAAGLGFRYDTIIGPVRVDLGFRLNRYGPMDPDPGSRFAFHLSLGEAF